MSGNQQLLSELHLTMWTPDAITFTLFRKIWGHAALDQSLTPSFTQNYKALLNSKKPFDKHMVEVLARRDLMVSGSSSPLSSPLSQPLSWFPLGIFHFFPKRISHPSAVVLIVTWVCEPSLGAGHQQVGSQALLWC